MRTSKILTWVMALCLVPALSKALEVPEGKAAILEAVIGKVKVTVAGKSDVAKVGQVLGFGDSLSTGANGRVSIRHADNAISRLAPNTELTLQAPGEKKGVFLKLALGAVRFLVGKRAPGESFEVATTNAVAAVKGTDGEVETDGTNTTGTVYESDHQRALELLDTLSGKSIFLDPGETVGLTKEGFEKRTLDPNDFKNRQERYNGLPQPNLGGEQGGDKTPAPDKGDQGAVPPKEDVKVDIADAVSDAFADAMKDMATDSFLEHDERTGDLVAGRIVYDRQGTRTQVSAFITKEKDHPDTLLKATYSKRTTGDFAGTSFAQEETTWNQALPTDWTTVVKTALSDPSNLDVNGYPIYYKLSQYFAAGNPQGDLMEVVRNYEVPTYYATYIGQDVNSNYLYDKGAINPTQGFSQGLYLDGQAIFYFDYLDNKASYDSYRVNDPNACTGCNVVVTSAPIASNSPYSYDQWYVTNTQTMDANYNTVGQTYTYNTQCCGNGTPFLTTNMVVLDNVGNLQNLYNVAPNMDYNQLPRDFKGIDNSLNIELTYVSPYMKAPIDLMIIPEVFDAMDMFDVPSTTGGGGL
jgi:hypothetical protein